MRSFANDPLPLAHGVARHVTPDSTVSWEVVTQLLTSCDGHSGPPSMAASVLGKELLNTIAIHVCTRLVKGLLPFARAIKRFYLWAVRSANRLWQSPRSLTTFSTRPAVHLCMVLSESGSTKMLQTYNCLAGKDTDSEASDLIKVVVDLRRQRWNV